MKTTNPKAERSKSAVGLVALAVALVAAGGSWLALRGGPAKAPAKEAAPAIATVAGARSPDPAAPVATAAVPRAEAPRTFHPREWKLGESFDYAVDSTRVVSVEKSDAPAPR